MSIETGSLVVRGTFGETTSIDGITEQRLQREMLDEMREMLAEADRRRGDR